MTTIFLKRFNGCLESYGSVILIYTILFLFVASPFVFFGDVVSPYNQCSDFGFPSTCDDSARVEQRGFTDHPSFYVPEVYQQLQGKRSGWMALWTDQNELGRPLSHLSGFSPAYLPSWIISWFTVNPWVFITILSLAMAYLAGLFIVLLARENSLHPLAGLVGGVAFGLSPNMLLWLIFPMYVGGWCWAAGALWGGVRLLKRKDMLGWFALAFSIYSLPLTSYPQYIVFHAWIVAAFFLVFLFRRRTLLVWKDVVLLFTAIFLGAILSLPALVDLVRVVADSNQGVKGISFFTMYLQGMNYWVDAYRFMVFVTQPDFFGNYADGLFKYPSYGYRITVLIVFFGLLGIFGAFRRTYIWLIGTVLCVVLTFSYSMYGFGVKYLGFNLNPILPIAISTLPLAIIAMYGADVLMSLKTRSFKRTLFGLATVGAISSIFAGVYYAYSYHLPLRWEIVFYTAVMLGFFCISIKYGPVALILGLSLVVMVTSFPVMYRQSSASILNSSPLVDAIREGLSEGGRYMIQSPGYGLKLLPPNLNARLGIATVHNSNSLASRRYQTWLEAMGEPKEWKGGRNSSLSPDYGSAMFWMSNIALVLSPERLERDNLTYVETVQGVQLYKVNNRMGGAILADMPYDKSDKGKVNFTGPGSVSYLKCASVEDKGDFKEYVFPPQKTASVFILSQKFYPDWKAMVYRSSQWQQVETLEVNGVFQGAVVPKGASRVRFEFQPYVRYSFIGHIIWILLGAFTMYGLARRFSFHRTVSFFRK